MPSWSDLRRFCEKDGWELYKKSRDDFYRKLCLMAPLKSLGFHVELAKLAILDFLPYP